MSPIVNGQNGKVMNHDQRVRLTGQYFSEKYPTNITGSICGMGHTVIDGNMVPVYMVRLDKGFFNPENTIHISIIPVHRDCLEPIA